MPNACTMWRDLEIYLLEPKGTEENDIGQDLSKCYTARYIEGDLKLAEKLKKEFTNKWKYWANWY